MVVSGGHAPAECAGGGCCSWVERHGLGTLLGPEDTGMPRVGVGASGGRLRAVPPGVGGGCGLVGGLLENCTVDASIFDLL